LAHALQNHGVREGSTVALLARNHAPFVEASVALSKLGAHILLLNTSMAPAQIEDICLREQPSHIIYDDEFRESLEHFHASGPGAACKLITTLATSNWASSHTSAAIPAPHKPGRTIILTSGTTGTPKGANRSAPRASSATLGMLEAIPYHRGEAMLIAAPLFHAWGFAHVAIAFALGCPIVLQAKFDPRDTIDAIATHRVGVLVAVPVMLRRMLEAAGRPTSSNLNTSSLRVVPLSGSSIPAGLAEAFMDQFGDVVYNLYGSTEVGSATVATPDDLRAAPGTAGRPPDGVELRIYDNADHPLEGGVAGRIFVRSALLFDGYTNGDNKAIIDGFMSTGDVGHLDTMGRLFVDGREDDMIVSGGENVYPREVEDLLAGHPDIVEAAVVGIDDIDFGQRLLAYVVLAPGASLSNDDVRAYVRNHLARYKVPRDVVFIDALPRNPTGKVLKRSLQ
jgi:acyl-CoA synthetase (AMP-forming)/AMP-acid ligase II